MLNAGLEEPLPTEDAFFGALVRGDVEVLQRLLADDFLLVDVLRGAEVGRSDLIDAIAAHEVRFTFLEVVERSVRRHGDMAIVVGRTEIRGEVGREPFAAASRYVHVFVRGAVDGWRLVSAQGTPIVG
jgi:ketosteroid isomerase-like protein